MSQFGDIFAEVAVPAIMDQFAGTSTVKYCHPDIDDVPLTAIVGPIRTEETESDSGQERKEVREVTISTDDASGSVYGGVSDPVSSAEIEIDGERWPIEALDRISESLAVLRVVRTHATERARRGYRGTR